MSTDEEIGRALAAIAATLNDQQLEQFDVDRVQEIVTASLGGEGKLRVDDGGGIHDESGVKPDDTRAAHSGEAGGRARGRRVGAIRRTPSGEWITERQNEEAARSDIAIPAAQPEGKLQSLLTKLKQLGG